MREIFEPMPELSLPATNARLRRVLYALPEEAWRIDAMLLLQKIYQKRSGWDQDLERITGKLLGYEERHIEAFLRRVMRRSQK